MAKLEKPLPPCLGGAPAPRPMSLTCDRLMPDGVSRCTMLYAHGHNEWLKEEERRQRIMAEQFKVSIPYEQRNPGWLYDHHSGLCMGLASDQLKKKQAAGVPFKMQIAGCPHELVIHPAPSVVVTDPKAIYEWTYSRSKGDIEVFAPDEAGAAQLVKETGLVKAYNPKKLTKSNSTLADRLKKESIK